MEPGVSGSLDLYWVMKALPVILEFKAVILLLKLLIIVLLYDCTIVHLFAVLVFVLTLI